MGFSSSRMATVGVAGQVAGAASSAVGAYYGAQVNEIAVQTQGQAIRHQAAMDIYNARASALTMNGQADLDMLSAHAQHNATLTGADFSTLAADSNRAYGEFQVGLSLTQAEAKAASLTQRAAIGLLNAQGDAAALEYSAQADDLSATLAELQAQSALFRGERTEQSSRQKYAQAKSSATASMAARGLDLGQGSALAVRNSMDLMSERAAIEIQQDALLAAFGHRVQKAQAELGAQAKRTRAASAVSSASLSASLAKADAAYGLGMARVEADAARAGLDAQASMARVNAEATRALSAAGLVSAQATTDYQRAVAGIMVDNASAASLVRTASVPVYSGSASGAAFGSLLGSAGSVTRSWYAYNRERR